MPAEREHPTEKPVPIMAALIDVQCEPGGGGAGSVHGFSGINRRGRVSMGRRFVGIEHDPAHFETALRRLEEARRNPAHVHASRSP
jgi:hypothetical protein